MKQLLTASLACLFLNAFANEGDIKIKSEIKEVTVFLSGAEITSVGNASIPAGASNVVFENLASGIDANTIQAKGEGDFTILEVSTRLNYLNQQPKSREIIALEDSLEALQNKISYWQNMRAVYEDEESMLLANKSIGGNNVGVSSAELEKVANILRTRLTDLKAKEQETRLKEKKLNEQIGKVNAQLIELNAKRNRTTGEIVVAVSSKTGGNIKLKVSYAVQSAGWVPYYDIRATDTKSPVQLNYRANVFQNTGDDWKNVKLTLSTGNPTQNGSKPLLNPWWLTYNTVYKKTYGRRKLKAEAYGTISEQNMPTTVTDSNKSSALTYNWSSEPQADYSSAYTTVDENATNMEYEISIPYTVLTDNKYHSVDIQSYSVPANYRYYSAPKLDKDAFLLAQITKWDQYNLLSGEANIYFEGTYVGKSSINTASTSDTFDISLGRDKNVVVTRTLLKELTEKKIVGLYRKETYTYEIAVRNKKKNDIEITVEDQVPLSNLAEIEVEAVELSGAKYDKTTGKLTWNLKAAASETQKVKMSFTVKYPKDKKITNL